MPRGLASSLPETPVAVPVGTEARIEVWSRSFGTKALFRPSGCGAEACRLCRLFATSVIKSISRGFDLMTFFLLGVWVTWPQFAVFCDWVWLKTLVLWLFRCSVGQMQRLPIFLAGDLQGCGVWERR